MRSALAISSRPKNFKEFVGHDKAIAGIVKLMKTTRPTAWLFSGGPGSGKTTLAQICARSYQELGQPATSFGYPKSAKPLDDLEILDRNAGDYNGVEDMRQLIDMANYMPRPPLPYRIFILEEAHALTAAAQTALLRPLEKPSNHQIWMLCTTDPQKLSAAIRRRCTEVALSALDDEGREKVIRRLQALTQTDKPIKKFIQRANKFEYASPGVVAAHFEAYINDLSASGVRANEEALIDLVRGVVKGERWPGSALKEMSADDLRGLRMMTLSYLTSMMCGQPSGALAEVIQTLGAPLPYEEPAIKAVIIARMYEVGAALQA